MFPSFETAIRKRSGEVCEVAGSEEVQDKSKGTDKQHQERVMSPATCNYTKRIQNQGRHKKVKTIKSVKSY